MTKITKLKTMIPKANAVNAIRAEELAGTQHLSESSVILELKNKPFSGLYRGPVFGYNEEECSMNAPRPDLRERRRFRPEGSSTVFIPMLRMKQRGRAEGGRFP